MLPDAACGEVQGKQNRVAQNWSTGAKIPTLCKKCWEVLPAAQSAPGLERESGQVPGPGGGQVASSSSSDVASALQIADREASEEMAELRTDIAELQIADREAREEMAAELKTEIAELKLKTAKLEELVDKLSVRLDYWESWWQ